MKDEILNFEWRPGVPIGDYYEEYDHVEMDIENEGENGEHVVVQEMIDEQDYHDEDPSPLIDGDSSYEDSDDEESFQEEGELLGGDALQDQLIDNATHDVVKIESETTDDEIRSESHSDEIFSDVEEMIVTVQIVNVLVRVII